MVILEGNLLNRWRNGRWIKQVMAYLDASRCVRTCAENANSLFLAILSFARGSQYQLGHVWRYREVRGAMFTLKNNTKRFEKIIWKAKNITRRYSWPRHEPSHLRSCYRTVGEVHYIGTRKGFGLSFSRRGQHSIPLGTTDASPLFLLAKTCWISSRSSEGFSIDLDHAVYGLGACFSKEASFLFTGSGCTTVSFCIEFRKWPFHDGQYVKFSS